MLKGTVVLAVCMLAATAASAATVSVTATGQVIFNGIADSPLGDVNSGDLATLSFTVDSDNFVEGVPGDTRGYVIDQSSFSLSFSSGPVVGLMDPFPGGETPYFTLVDGFPVSDGFFVSTSPNSRAACPWSRILSISTSTSVMWVRPSIRWTSSTPSVPTISTA